jgi:hypothetical protein
MAEAEHAAQATATIAAIGFQRAVELLLEAQGWRSGPVKGWWTLQSAERTQICETLEAAVQQERQWQMRRHVRAGTPRRP